MATYAIADIQGCAAEFAALLEKVAFDPGRDRLWLLGDLVNRGPDSLSVMRQVMALRECATLVLGNHDLHFLAIWYGGHSPNAGDTFAALLDAPDAANIADWLRRQRFFHQDPALGYAMAHAGILPEWTFADAAAASDELMAVLQGRNFQDYFRRLYGNQPDRLTADLSGMARWRILTNCFTRMRLLDAQGRLNFTHKGSLHEAPAGCRPWFAATTAPRPGERLLFGHWAALQGRTGRNRIIALDTGCVWGRELTALCLETGHRISVPAFRPRRPVSGPCAPALRRRRSASRSRRSTP